MNGCGCAADAAAGRPPQKRQGLAVALAAGDEKMLRVIGSYFLESKAFARCDAYRRGRTLLNELCGGRHFDALLLDEQLLDMDALGFLEEYRRMNRQGAAPLFVMIRRSRPALCEQLAAGGVLQFFFKPCGLAEMAQRIQLLAGDAGMLRAYCSRFCREMGIQNDTTNCGYLIDAVLAAACRGDDFAFGKEVAVAVGELHGVSPAAVESGLRRLIARMEKNDTAAYRKFRNSAVTEPEKLTPERLVRAVMQAAQKSRREEATLCNV